MKKFLLAVVLLCSITFTSRAQRNCGSHEYLMQQIEENPERAKTMEAIEKHTRQIAGTSIEREVITIPVVVHVVYRTSAENISDAQIQSQIDVLNDDFRRLNSDADGTWSQAADTEIEFCLATVDPDGNATNGITRTSTTVNGFGTNDSVKFDSSGGKDAWPASDYLNFWVCNIGGGILGYAQFPGGPASTDGVVNDYRYTGTIGTATSPFDLGRTATHEVGHWLNLRHIWGDGNCNVDDFVSDTPTSDAANYGCATGHASCGTTDMVQNYMDYSDDACMNLFTLGQKNRMQALFATGGFRESIKSSTACGTPPTPTCNDGVQNGDETGVDCGGSCDPCSTGCSNNLVNISITLDNYPEETSWVITNASGSIVASGGTYGSQPDGSTVSIDECLTDGCYDFTISDTYGDGICCSYGNGSYTVSSGGVVLASGGAFGSSETTNMCLGGTAPTCDDGVQNGLETGVDCGGPDCPACPTCNDGVQNGSETGVDCGGPDCPACPTCDDGIQNGSETGTDCGGPDCPACPTCDDGIQNGDETGVDCGGSCAPCSSGCSSNEVTVSITLDNYPEETSWTITDDGGSVVASGGTYGSQPDGSTVEIDECLADGCYDFTISDTYGDGICCSYGNGSYNVSSGGSILASGGSFGSSETTNFCLGVTGPTCDDGVQNGDETGVDCGGSCDPCSGGSDVLSAHFFETGWDGWQDGGSDCYRYSGTNSYEGTRSIRIRDNSGVASAMTSSVYNLSGYSSVMVEFYFYPNSMENNEDFWLRYNDGSGWQTVATYASGTNFQNGSFYVATVTLDAGTHNLTNGAQFRFQCDASGNGDQIYIDAVTIIGNGSGAKVVPDAITLLDKTVQSKDQLGEVSIYPNPTSEKLTIHTEDELQSISVYSVDGRLMQYIDELDSSRTTMDVSTFTPGIYFITVETDMGVITDRIVKQ